VTSLSVTRDSAPPDSWRSYVSGRGLFYHDPRWLAAISAQFRYRVHCLTALTDGVTVGILPLAEVPGLLGPRRLVSLPFGYAAGPLADTDTASERLCDSARRIALERGIRRLEIKRRDPAAACLEGFERSGHYATYVVATDGGADAVWDRLHADSTRRGIRKAERSAVAAAQEDSEESWRLMARLQQQTAARLGLPAPPSSFFVQTCRQLQHDGLADLFLARRADGRAIAGVVVWKGPREWIYAFGASERQHLSLRPVHAVLWLALRTAAEAGVAFDLGRAAPEQQGLVQFKLRWGGEPLPLAYDYWPKAAGLNTVARDRGLLALGGRLWSRIPWRITARGSWLYRYLG